ncbi:something about silencing, SAS, complex subunit 4-domain-containing protein [Lophiotrema nucula]|uniref:Something about silencing, SAS, complex subunit 4-domain-containing protein n=1 Tax=Lophiotrema nucula TaxID=690887 RepID=A0A6A5ZH31_9PLEO|nr:something about silencing, SAS, complex subunit 4-domain-containing protein [Lophiotrema nucula]
MANLMQTRPPLRASSERRSSTRHRTPAINDVENRTTPPRHNHTISTRRSSKATSLAGLNDEKPVAVAPAVKPATLARASSTRKRPATAIADATADTRPPTKVTVTQPHGELLRITNGVPAALGIGQDALPSGASTPKANGAASAALTAPTPAGQDKRSLRSHDGTGRLKSDLTIYFANYDDVIADVPREKEFLELETPIYIVDEPLKTTNPPHPLSPEPSRRSSLSPTRSRKSRGQTPSRKASIASLPAAPSSTAFQTLDYSSIAKHVRHNKGEDPLADSMFFTQHRRAERKEKQLRNIEKERAMHEKVQLERLLDGLQGPDWLKVMGITGVTDGEKKDWEPKRDYFVKEVELLVDKFRIWKEEEKRLRAEKEAALAAREGDEDDEVETGESDETGLSRETTLALEQRVRKEPSTPKLRRPPRPHGFLLPILPPEPRVPFVSFYAKPHLRAAALGKHRHGRNATAFGQAIPDFEEHEFCPPEELITIEALRDHARKRRRQKRESKG